MTDYYRKIKKDFFLWKRKPLKECDPRALADCIKFCWDTLPEKKRRWAKKLLLKIAKRLAKDKCKKRKVCDESKKTS